MRIGGSGVAFCVAGHEIVAYIALESSAIGAGPVIRGGDRVDARDGCLEVLGQADKSITFRNVIAIDFSVEALGSHALSETSSRCFDIFDAGLTAPDNLLVSSGRILNMIVTGALCANRSSGTVEHVVHNPMSVGENQIIGSPAKVGCGLLG